MRRSARRLSVTLGLAGLLVSDGLRAACAACGALMLSVCITKQRGAFHLDVRFDSPTPGVVALFGLRDAARRPRSTSSPGCCGPTAVACRWMTRFSTTQIPGSRCQRRSAASDTCFRMPFVPALERLPVT